MRHPVQPGCTPRREELDYRRAGAARGRDAFGPHPRATPQARAADAWGSVPKILAPRGRHRGLYCTYAYRMEQVITMDISGHSPPTLLLWHISCTFAGASLRSNVTSSLNALPIFRSPRYIFILRRDQNRRGLWPPGTRNDDV